MNMSEVKLHVSHESVTQNCASIILANFTNGQLNEKRCKDLKFHIYQKTEGQNGPIHKQKILVAESDQVSYVGQNFGGELISDAFQYFIGIREHGSHKMRLVSADVFAMKPSFPDDLDRRPKPVDVPRDEELTYRQKADRLTGAFGSSKGKRAVKSRLQLTVDADLVQSTIGQAGLSAVNSGSYENRATEESNENSLFPPCNQTAETREDVYNLRDIISEADLEAMSHVIDVLTESTHEQHMQWAAERKYCKFIVDQLSRLPLGEPARSHKAKCLLYLHYMFTLFHKKAHDLRKKDAIPADWPGVCKKSLVEKFFSRVGGADRKPQLCMPARLKDKLAIHILIVCLLLEEFVLPLEELRAELHFGKPKICLLMQRAGCKVRKIKSGKTSEDFAHLELPLTFPKPRIMMKKMK